MELVWSTNETREASTQRAVPWFAGRSRRHWNRSKFRASRAASLVPIIDENQSKGYLVVALKSRGPDFGPPVRAYRLLLGGKA